MLKISSRSGARVEVEDLKYLLINVLSYFTKSLSSETLQRYWAPLKCHYSIIYDFM